MKLNFFVLTFFLVVNVCDAARILLLPAAIVPSHKLQFLRLAEELIQRGHEVVIWQVGLKPDKLPAPKGLEQRFWSVEVPEKYIRNMFLYENSTIYSKVWDENVVEISRKAGNWAMMARVCELMLDERKSDFDALVNEHFDVTVVDDLFNPCGLLIVGLNRRPFVYWSQTHLRTETAWSSQTPNPPSYIPVPGTGLTDDMDFWQRSFNFLSYIKTIYIHQRIILRPMHNLFLTYYPELTDPFYIERNASLNFINTPPIFDFPRPFMPRVIFVGGLQCRKAQPLTGDVKTFIDGATEQAGFMLFTTGFSIQWQRAPKHVIESFVEGFRDLPQRFIWQYDGPAIKNLPKNVMVMPWLPQQDLLGHPKCKGFITHGGLNSIVEAMWHGVPVLGIPVFADHLDNILRATAPIRGAGFVLHKQYLTAERVSKAVRKLHRTPDYAENAKIMSELLQDVPYTELEHAAWWLEFIVRHQEVPQARSGADDLNLIQYFLIDVFAFLFACATLALIVLFYVLKFAFKGCCWGCRKCFAKAPVTEKKKKQ